METPTSGSVWPIAGSAGMTLPQVSFFSLNADLRQAFLECEYDTVEEFLVSIECPSDASFVEPQQIPRYLV